MIAIDDISVYAAFKKSALLLLDNFRLSLGIFMLLFSTTTIFTVSGIGLVVIGLSSAIVICSVTTREVLRRYRPEKYPIDSADEEKRSFKHVFQPWSE